MAGSTPASSPGPDRGSLRVRDAVEGARAVDQLGAAGRPDQCEDLADDEVVVDEPATGTAHVAARVVGGTAVVTHHPQVPLRHPDVELDGGGRDALGQVGRLVEGMAV